MIEPQVSPSRDRPPPQPVVRRSASPESEALRAMAAIHAVLWTANVVGVNPRSIVGQIAGIATAAVIEMEALSRD